MAVACLATTACTDTDPAAPTYRHDPAATASPRAAGESYATPEEIAACEKIDYSDPAQGRLTFSEDFDGSALDPSRWRVRDDTYLDFDQAQIRAENVTVHDGLLDIAGRRLPESEWITTPRSRYDWNQVRDYSTGYVDGIKDAEFGSPASADRFSQRYGYFEIRAKLPSRSTMSRGVWPAFWLRGDSTLGEIDPMEAYGGPTSRRDDPSATYFWNSWEETTQIRSKDHADGRVVVPGGEPIWQDFHTFGVNWSPTCLRYTLDGRTVGVVSTAAKPYLAGPAFDDTFHVRLNMQVGSNYWGRADPRHTRDEFHYLVDWVRVHQGFEHLP